MANTPASLPVDRQSAQSPPAGSPLDVSLRRVLAQPKALLLAAALSAVAAAAAAWGLGHERYRYEGKLLHAPNSATAPYYQSPNLGSLVQLALSPNLLGKIRSECQISDDVATLRSSLDFDLSQNDILTVTLTRNDPAEAERILNQLLTDFVDATGQLRRTALSRFVDGFGNDAKAARARYDQAQRLQQDFLATHRLATPEELRDRGTTLRQTIAGLELSLQTTRSLLLSAEAKREHLGGVLADDGGRVVTNKVAIANSKQGGVTRTALEVPPSRQSDTERRTILKDQIRQQQESASFAIKVKVKKDELARARALREKRLISQAEVEHAAGELALLEAEQNAHVQEMVDDLSAIEDRIDLAIRRDDAASLVSVTATGERSDPSLAPTRNLAVLDLDILGTAEQAKDLEQLIERKQAELAMLGGLQKQFAPMEEELRLSSEEWERLQRLVDGFRQTKQSDVAEVTVAAPAALAFDGISSNRSKVFSAVFAAAMVLLTAPRLASEWRQVAAGR